MKPKHWEIAFAISQEQQDLFAHYHPAILQLLWNRGFYTQEAIDIFLAPDWKRDAHHPQHFSQMVEAVNLIFEALEHRQVISIHGDYDADGVCGTAVMIITLRDICRQLGYDESRITHYIPHREKEGYGISKKTVEHLFRDVGTKLIVTVDCGISNIEAIAHAKTCGINVIVCDHHDVPEALPNAVLIHPQVKTESYPYKYLSGTGVAYKVAHALIEKANEKGAGFHEGYEKWLLDLVAISTITDIMPLTGENRVLEKYGLLVLNKTRRLGLHKLVEVSGGIFGKLDSVSIGYQIGPRLNAAGRMQHANVALELLIAEDEQEAEQLAQELQELNAERQKQSEAIFQEAKRQVENANEQALIIAVGEGWPAGLVGLVAGKLVAEYGRPVFVVGKENEFYVGSGRSVGRFHMTEALQKVSEHLDAFGGHPQACGFSTTGKERLEKVIEGLQQYSRNIFNNEMPFSIIQIDGVLDLNQINWEFLQKLERFSPHGEKNPRPIFLSERVEVKGIDVVGINGKHLRLTIQSSGGALVKMIGFKFGDWIHKLRLGSLIDVVYEIGVNEWNGTREIQLILKDLMVSE
ncbi:MAG: Single-stranded-DNA-specific exonuclease RecJ [Candidatus Uhrbacteria bacterium GW2011_GWE2_40_58]|nr:MAG: Single-stranded-DNA-specific exonuclease RecJ [Candidatus Uhrbacteria bacterium GW2011_GWF2_40_263]KKR67956.1 MAG: Single-stranded-DNA-specific exonuclease RecJ [Candidatus Uhrbacteria bacterium GW2011_GWE2_40_58]OGL92402.1 MAG: single-stranded-DNA-specific exonuclease RecJ [Candidatus Uhrbacteria bacterium RIFOXYA2_FULL_40_9]OGL96993.1 MAG: single-stranded-DNA-specific exonuclease RecJ [Candidatus Uhrbacteria bacterium RIFOXYB2_FULL_41_18]HBK34769.1 single-stranded-DNA-specific exonucl